jgi:transcriptional regulator with XRE-family HTH domain
MSKRRRRENARTPFHPVDVHVGRRMRQRRTMLGLSQTTLGTAAGLTFQQVQKYENGSNRVSASRLVEFAEALDVPIAYFFEEQPTTAVHSVSSRRAKSRRAGTPLQKDDDPMAQRETLQLVRAYYRIREPCVRKRLYEMIVAIGPASERAPSGKKHDTGK